MRRAFDTVSARMILVILLSSGPLAILSGFVSWHSYEAASGASALRGELLIGVFRTRLQQTLSDAQELLGNVAALRALRSRDSCQAALALALATQRQSYRSIGLFGVPGLGACQAGAPIAPDEIGGSPGIGRVTVKTDTDGVPEITARLAIRVPETASAVLLADLRLGWSRTTLFGPDGRSGLLGGPRRAHAWLLGPGGIAAPVCVDCGWTPPADLHRLAALAAAAHGAPVATPEGSVASGVLTGPVSLLTITRPTDQEVYALSLFIIRVIGIVLLLGVGLLGVALGANMLIVTPLHRLTAAVTHWRRAGGYDPGVSRLMPVELRELSRAFQQATHNLALHERGLRESEARQELLIKEIHHRVKNNLQIIASLLNLQANRIRLPEARAEFASARDRVRALATLHRYLYSEGDLQTLNMRSFLQELAAQLFQAIGEKQGRRIQLHIDAPEIAMATDQAVPLALVVTEAISNAIKYAFPDGRSGHVRVSLTELGEGMGRLVLEDDGVGIPAGRAETETGVRDGLGIQLIRGFSRQLGAQLDVQEGAGTRYTLTFPLHPKAPESAPKDGPEGGAEGGDPGSVDDEATPVAATQPG